MKDRLYKRSKHRTIAIIAGGVPPDTFIGDITSVDVVIGVDRGAYWLAKHKVPTDLAVGDFDSVTASERKVIEKHAKRVIAYPAKKDATDLELAIDEAIQLHPKTVTIYGALGNRFDHSMAAIQMLLKLESHNILGQIVDNFNKINIVRRLHILKRSRKYSYVSIIPVTTKATVSLLGFAYDVTRRQLIFGSTLGISNEIRHTNAKVVVHDGAVFVVCSADRFVR